MTTLVSLTMWTITPDGIPSDLRVLGIAERAQVDADAVARGGRRVGDLVDFEGPGGSTIRYRVTHVPAGETG